MSFLSVLGKIGKAALPFIPGVGPVASAALNAAGTIAGGASRQRAQDRGAQAEYDVSRVPVQNAQALQYANARMGADQARMRQIGSADMLGNSRPPTDPRARLSGAGYMNPETIAMMRERAMKALESGSDVPQLQTMPDRPGGGGTKTDSFLNALSMAGTGVGALREAGVFGGNDGGRGVSVNAPADLEASIYGARDEDAPWWSPLRRGN